MKANEKKCEYEYNGWMIDLQPSRTRIVEENDCYFGVLDGFLFQVGVKLDLVSMVRGFFETVANAQPVDFNNYHGSFRVLVYSKVTHTLYIACDNSKTLTYYIDKSKQRISDSFLRLVELREGDFAPNYSALRQFMNTGSILTDETLVSGIESLSSDCYYAVSENSVGTLSDKGLGKFSKSEEDLQLRDIIEASLNTIGRKRLAAACTGGTDSRSVIGWLLHSRQEPLLVISGHDDNPDIKVAKRISDATHLELRVVDPNTKGLAWIEEGADFADGLFDSVLAHRHLLIARTLEADGILYKYGGLAGEFYKNDFCPMRNPRFWRSLKTRDSFLSFYTEKFERNHKWYGDDVKSSAAVVDGYMADAIRRQGDMALLQKGNCCGFYKLTRKAGTLTNAISRYCIQYDPLVDRALIISASKDSIASHSSGKWQRREVAKASPFLSEIPTDRGRTMSLSKGSLILDTCKDMANEVKRRIGKPAGMKGYWDSDYDAARRSDAFSEALELCKRNGIICQMVVAEDIPLTAVGRIITIGKVLSMRDEGN